MGRLHRFSGVESAFDWEGAPEKEVDPRKSSGVTGKLLIGPQDGASNFRIRYFRIEPGGHSPLERHPHDHGVFILHGQARVRMGSEEITAGPRDALYIPGNERHQLRTVGDEPLGFLCAIPPK
jgi:quercetin dioxygenase-like cupin family protein